LIAAIDRERARSDPIQIPSTDLTCLETRAGNNAAQATLRKLRKQVVDVRRVARLPLEITP